MHSSQPVFPPLWPPLGRILLSAVLIMVCGGAALFSADRTRLTGLVPVGTPVRVGLNGASRARLDLNVTSADLLISALAPGAPDLLNGRAYHRERNGLNVTQTRQGETLNVAATLEVTPVNPGALLGSFRSLQHVLKARLTPDVPVTLSTRTTFGDQTLDLRGTRLRGLTVSSEDGDLTLSLPGRASGAVSVRAGSGDVRVTAPQGGAPSRLDLRTGSGDLHLVTAARTDADVRATSGDLSVRVLPEAGRQMNLQTTSGDVTLILPPGLGVKIVTSPDLDLEIPDRLIRQGGTYATSRTALTRPALTVTVRTVSGRVRIEQDDARNGGDR